MSTTPIELIAEPRDRLGTRESRRLRREGKLPAVIYGHGEETQSISLPGRQAIDSLQKGAHVFDLKLAGGSQQVLVKQVQYDHLGQEVLHVDLFRVNPNEEVTSSVAVVLTGDLKVATEGGVLTQMRDTIDLVCKVSDLPDEIRHDVTNLPVGGVLHVSELKLPEGVALPPHDADFTIATVTQKRGTGDTPETGAPVLTSAQPEVIGEKKTAVPPGQGNTKKSPNA